VSRLNCGRYKPSRWTYPEVRRVGAGQVEVLVVLFLLAVGTLCAAAEPIMDWLEMVLR
jgi:hypothetical protein